MTTNEHAHPTGYKQYFTTWLWLLGMTLLALAVGYIEGIPGTVKTFLLVGVTLAKIFLIGSIFMHLKSERVNLVMLTFSPLVLAIIMFTFTSGETRGTDSTHKIENISPACKDAERTCRSVEGKAEEHSEEHK